MGTGLLGRPSPGQHRLHLQLRPTCDVAAVVHRLGAIGAVLLTAAGLHAQQRGQLHPVAGVGRAMHRLGPPEQLHQRQFQQRLDLSSGPVVAEGEGRLGEGGGQGLRKSQGETGSTPPKRRWRLW